jgi:hypothetical protein
MTEAPGTDGDKETPPLRPFTSEMFILPPPANAPNCGVGEYSTKNGVGDKGELQDTVAARLPRPLSVSVMFSEVREMEIQGRLRRTAAPLRF